MDGLGRNLLPAPAFPDLEGEGLGLVDHGRHLFREEALLRFFQEEPRVEKTLAERPVGAGEFADLHAFIGKFPEEGGEERSLFFIRDEKIEDPLSAPTESSVRLWRFRFPRRHG